MQRHQVPSLDDLPDTALVRQAQILCWIPISASTFWRLYADSSENFPRSHKLSPGVTVWKVGDIRSYIAKKCDSKIAVSRGSRISKNSDSNVAAKECSK